MDIMQYLSFQGRISRKTYWMATLVFCAITILVALIDSMVLNEAALSGIVSLLIMWPSLALSVRRWHDRGRSGWFVLVVLIPVIGALWAFIELGFLRGVPGSNQFGADPLAS